MRLHELIEQGREAVASDRLSRLIELDFEFHNTMYGAAGNQVIADMMRVQFAIYGGRYTQSSAPLFIPGKHGTNMHEY